MAGAANGIGPGRDDVFKFKLRIELKPGNVMNAVDRARQRAQAPGAAYTRAIMIRSMPKRESVSKPGGPPNSHTGKIRRLIRFAYEPRTGSTVIGPLGESGSTAMEALEHGGRSVIRRRLRNGATRRRFIWIQPRPFARPALERAAATGKIVAGWKGAAR